MPTLETTTTMPILDVRGIGKRFGHVTALSDVSFDVHAGEVHALVGENGAGKSTLLSIMNGLQAPDSGELRLNGRRVTLDGAAAARRQGMAMVHQELALCPNLTVAENLFLCNEPQTRFGVVDMRAMCRRAHELLEAMSVAVDPLRLVSTLSLSERQLVEICKGLASNPQVLVLDEPTASLTDDHVGKLLTTLRRLRGEGLAVIYVSHRLEEVLAIADRITVLRDGAVVDRFPVDQATESRMIHAMVGRSLGERFPPRTDQEFGAPVLEGSRMAVAGCFDDISLSVRAGEVVGIAGLLGCERETVIRALFGIHKLDSGKISVKGVVRRFRHSLDAIRAGIAYLPADRQGEGLVLGMSVHDNLALTTLSRLSRWGLISRRARNRQGRALIDRLRIKAGNPESNVVNLSGGNQQKVVLAKWLARDADILIVDEPTRGVDIGGKEQIWQALRQASQEGRAILMVSSELPELMGLCDRILVMSRGRVTGDFSRDQFDATEIARCAVAS